MVTRKALYKVMQSKYALHKITDEIKSFLM